MHLLNDISCLMSLCLAIRGQSKKSEPEVEGHFSFYYFGISVNIRRPCMPWISSFSTWLTNWCCWTVRFPLNSLDSIWISYMAPQPPDISRTLSLEARGNFSFRILAMRSSPSVCDDKPLCSWPTAATGLLRKALNIVLLQRRVQANIVDQRVTY